MSDDVQDKAVVAMAAIERERMMEERAERLNALGQALARKRKEAIDRRRASGIEDEWRAAEDAYQGIDDANRGSAQDAWGSKPPGQAWPQREGGVRSTVFLNITRPYVDTAAARIGDMLLPSDDKNWALRPTPLPELVEKTKDDRMVPDPLAQVQPGEQAPMVRSGDIAQLVLDAAMAKARKAEKRIEDYLVEGRWHSQVRRVIEDAARIGSGVLKGPFPQMRRDIAFVDEGGVMALHIREKICPESRAISPWNFYPDPACGESIHDGEYVWERDMISPRALRRLRDEEGYLADQIDACLAEGPQKPEVQHDMGGSEKVPYTERHPFEIWYYYGMIDAEDLAAIGLDVDRERIEPVPAIITMVNNRVIRAAMNPLETGEFPYDVFPWKRRPGMPWGSGVAKEISVAQEMINAATRNMMDNAALSAGPQIIVLQKVVSPADGTWEITPRKVWHANPYMAVEDVQNAFGVVNIPTMQAELMAIIQFALKIAEDVTGLPMLLQGQKGDAPNTYGGQMLVHNNANAVLRRVAKLFDDYITEPHITRYYRWLMIYGEYADEKGDFTIDARGSSALVERDLQKQQIMQMGQIVANPIFGLDPKKWAREMLAAQHFDVKRFEFDDEQWQKIVENMANGPPDPRLAIAEMNAKLKQMELALQAQEKQKDREQELMLAAIEAELERAKQAGEKMISLDKIKAALAQTAISERNKRDLFVAEKNLKLRMGSGI